MRLAVTVLVPLALSACIVAGVRLEGRRCSAAHPCVEGYRCVDGTCFSDGYFDRGEEHGDCLPGDTCLDALVCVDGRCEAGAAVDGGGLSDDGGVDGGVDGGAPDAGSDDAGPLDAGPPPPLFDDALAGWWSFNDEPVGGVVADISASGLDGVARGDGGPAPGPTRIVGVFGAAVRFDGDDDDVVVLDDALLDVGERYAVEAWVRTTDACTGEQPIVARLSFTASWIVSCLDSGAGAVAHAGFRDAAGFVRILDGAAAINDGAWHHVVATRDGPALRLYVDGALADSDSAAVLGATDSDGPLSIGSDSTPFIHSAADIDEARLWRRALDDDDVADLFALIRPPLLGYWAFEGDLLNAGGASYPLSGFNVDLARGLRGRGALLDGSDARLQLQSLPDEVLAASYTWSLWLKTTATSASQVLFHGVGTRVALDVVVTSLAVGASLTSANGAVLTTTTAASVTDGAWHHVVVVREGADEGSVTVRLYVDGAPATAPASGVVTDTVNDQGIVEIGYRVGGDERRLAGTVDELMLFVDALPEEAVQALYEAGPP